VDSGGKTVDSNSKTSIKKQIRYSKLQVDEKTWGREKKHFYILFI
jgi:hypothetical protein